MLVLNMANEVTSLDVLDIAAVSAFVSTSMQTTTKNRKLVKNHYNLRQRSYDVRLFDMSHFKQNNS